MICPLLGALIVGDWARDKWGKTGGRFSWLFGDEEAEEADEEQEEKLKKRTQENTREERRRKSQRSQMSRLPVTLPRTATRRPWPSQTRCTQTGSGGRRNEGHTPDTGWRDHRPGPVLAC